MLLFVLSLAGCSSQDVPGAESGASSQSVPASQDSAPSQSAEPSDPSESSEPQSREEESSREESASSEEPASSGSGESSVPEAEDPYSFLPDGRYRTRIDPENDNYQSLCEAEFSHSADTLYLRLNDISSDGYRTINWVYKVPLSEVREGEPVVISGQYDEARITDLDGTAVEIKIGDEDSWDPWDGTYYYEPTQELVYPRPPVNPDPNTPGGNMDAGLAACARNALEMEKDAVLTAEDCEKITVLNVYNQEGPVATLDGIEYFKNLKRLDVADSSIEDLSGIGTLTELERLSISNGVAEELPDLSGCVKLRELMISGLPLKNINALADMPALEDVTVIDSNVSSIAPLKDNHTIRRLAIDSCCVSDWECIAGNEDLKEALMFDYEDYVMIEERAKEILAETITDDMSDLEKQVRLKKYIEDMITYEYVDEGNEGHPFLYYPFFRGAGVCRDYADAAKYLMGLAGMEVRNCSSNSHEWSIIRLGGKWYEFDCTWDDDADPEDWCWFNKSRFYMSETIDHELVAPEMYPIAQEDMPYALYAPYLED